MTMPDGREVVDVEEIYQRAREIAQSELKDLDADLLSHGALLMLAVAGFSAEGMTPEGMRKVLDGIIASVGGLMATPQRTH